MDLSLLLETRQVGVTPWQLHAVALCNEQLVINAPKTLQVMTAPPGPSQSAIEAAHTLTHTHTNTHTLTHTHTRTTIVLSNSLNYLSHTVDAL